MISAIWIDPVRVLFLTNYFPPFEPGGQGQSILEIYDGLSERGHVCAVLTSMHGVGNRPAAENGIYRRLYLEVDAARLQHSLVFFTLRKRREQINLRRFGALISEFRPDVILICGMWNLPRSLAVLAERRLPGRVAYRFAEYWPSLPTQHEMYWQAPPRSRLTGIPKRILSRIALAMLEREAPLPDLAFEHVYCVSAGTRNTLLEAGIPVAHARIIHTGLDFPAGDGAFPGDEESPGPDRPLKLLYAGRLSVEKGVDTAIQAVAELDGRPQSTGFRVHLSIAGAGRRRYLTELHALVQEFDLEDAVTFLGRRPPAEMPALMRSCDVLIVPSRWPEPFARVVLEGMHSRLAVLATPVGGSTEVIEDGVNGLLFPVGDSTALASRIRTLIEDPARRSSLAGAGWETVTGRFSQKAMLDAIETFLTEAAAGVRNG